MQADIAGQGRVAAKHLYCSLLPAHNVEVSPCRPRSQFSDKFKTFARIQMTNIPHLQPIARFAKIDWLEVLSASESAPLWATMIRSANPGSFF